MKHKGDDAMINDVPLIDLRCNCGRVIAHSFATSEHLCRYCNVWNVFVDGKIIRVEPPHIFKERLKAGRSAIEKNI
jgi:hypothetical protein